LFQKFIKFSELNKKEIFVNPVNPLYCSLLAWRSRQCLKKNQALVPADVESILYLSDLSESSHSMVKAGDLDDDDDEISIDALTYDSIGGAADNDA
jgi:hypothetical protein